jgi:hypothetical protein
MQKKGYMKLGGKNHYCPFPPKQKKEQGGRHHHQNPRKKREKNAPMAHKFKHDIYLIYPHINT